MKSTRFRESLLYNLIEKHDKWVLAETKFNLQLHQNGESSYQSFKSSLHIPLMFECSVLYIGTQLARKSNSSS